jgi:hypothetical protein
VLKRRLTAIAVGLALCLSVGQTSFADPLVKSKMGRNVKIAVCASALLAMAGIPLFTYINSFVQAHYSPVQTIEARTLNTDQLLGADGRAVFNIEDGNGEIPSITLKLGSKEKAKDARIRFMQMLDPTYVDEQDDDVIYIAITHVIFERRRDNPEYVNVLFRMVGLKSEIQMPEPLMLSSIESDSPTKQTIALKISPPEGNGGRGEIGFQFTFLRKLDALDVHRAELKIHCPKSKFGPMNIPAFDISQSMKGLVGYRQPNSLSHFSAALQE